MKYSALAIAVVSTILHATTINVPADQPTIQAGIDDAVDGDTVLVQQGTYFENIDFNGMNIVVGSLFLITGDTSYLSQTVIDGNQNGSVVTFSNGETSVAKLSGFTVTNGLWNQMTSSGAGGGGIQIWNSSPTLSYLAISGNEAGAGGGIWVGPNARPQITNSLITKNIANDGGGIDVSDGGEPIITNCVITLNEGVVGAGYGSTDGANAVIRFSTITNNIGPGIQILNSSLLIENSIVYHNTDGIIADPTAIDAIHCILQNSWAGRGNIVADPRFDASHSDKIILSDYSPAIGSGFDTSGIDLDFYGNPRPNPLGTNPDIGAYEHILGIPEGPQNRVRHVSPVGSDETGSGSEDNPFASIQMGIDATFRNGDTVLVQPGRYVEQINFNGKNIVLGSLAMTTGDTAYISRTIIDGNSAGSVVTFEAGEDSTAELHGFTIENGYSDGHTTRQGGGIHCVNANPILSHLYLQGNMGYTGGAMHLEYSDALISHLLVRNNNTGLAAIYLASSNATITNFDINNNSRRGVAITRAEWGESGYEVSMTSGTIHHNRGGGIVTGYGSTLSISDVSITYNTGGTSGAGLLIGEGSVVFDSVQRCSIYGNISDYHSDIAYITDPNVQSPQIMAYMDTFTVQYPTLNEASIFEPALSFDIRTGIIDQYAADMYVNSSGSNENTGLTSSQPLRTMRFAVSRIIYDQDNPRQIHLAPGLYSPSITGERFPFIISGNVSLAGTDVETTILDAEGTNSAIWVSHGQNIQISDLTIQNGDEALMEISSSTASLENVLIFEGDPGAHSLTISDSRVHLNHVTMAAIPKPRSSNAPNVIIAISSDLIINNSVIWHHVNPNIRFTSSSSEDTLLISNSCIQRWGESAIVGTNENNIIIYENNIDTLPLFCAPESGDFHLGSNSPGVGAGENGTTMGALAVSCGEVVAVDNAIGVPAKYWLHQNYPNPFNPTTSLAFDLPQQVDVSLRVYDIMGREVITIVNESMAPGYHQMVWDGRDGRGLSVPSGIYIARLVTPEYSKSVKMVLLK